MHRSLCRQDDESGSLPCWVDVNAGTTTCPDVIRQWRDASGVNANGFRWSPDGRQISFIYWNYQTTSGGLCLLDLSAGDVSCPATEAALPPANFVIDHSWSPDGRYLSLYLNPNGPESDDHTASSAATLARDGSQLHIWGRALTTLGGGGLWRPLLSGNP